MHSDAALNEHHLEIATGEGVMPTFVVAPARPGRFPGVILLMDALGIRAELYRIARLVAAQGYVAVLPDLYHRFGLIRPNLLSRDRTLSSTIGEIVMTCFRGLKPQMVLSDTDAVLAALRDDPLVAAGPVGAIGFCMSGGFVLHVAGSRPRDIGATAAIYGTGIVTDQDDSPHLLAKAIRGGLYIAWAENDSHVEPSVADDLAASLAAAKVEHLMKTIPGTTHGFCFADRRKTFHAAGSATVWADIFELLSRSLGNSRAARTEI